MAVHNNTVVEVNVAQVNRYEGHRIMIPQVMDLRQAGEAMVRAAEEEERSFDFHATVQTAPFDGALAFHRALEEQYGVVMQRAVFGERHVIDVPIDAHGGTAAVPWGAFNVPGIPGTYQTSYSRDDDGRVIFQATANIPGKYKDAFDEIMALTRENVRTRSIYRGKALDLRLTGDGIRSGTAKIKFFDTSRAIRPIYSADLADAFEYDVIPYVTNTSVIQRLVGKAKLGVLFAGPYGVGKTMAVLYLALLCEQQGRTFIQGHVQDFEAVLDFAAMYSPSLVSFEDVDSAVGGDERTYGLNAILNKLDGVDTKSNDILFVATTNHPERLNKAMLRPGRIDVIMNIEAPDAGASIDIAKHYARGMVKADEDFTEAGRVLAGQIPAVIEQAVNRALVRGELMNGNPELTGVTLLAAARAVQRERSHFEHRPEPTKMEELGRELGRSFGQALGQAMNDGVSVNGHELEAVR